MVATVRVVSDSQKPTYGSLPNAKSSQICGEMAQDENVGLCIGRRTAQCSKEQAVEEDDVKVLSSRNIDDAIDRRIEAAAAAGREAAAAVVSAAAEAAATILLERMSQERVHENASADNEVKESLPGHDHTERNQTHDHAILIRSIANGS